VKNLPWVVAVNRVAGGLVFPWHCTHLDVVVITIVGRGFG
jgi:hypothetical protein